MKTNLIIVIESVLIVLIGFVIAAVESYFLVKNGLSFDCAMIVSLYTGFLVWVIVAAVLFPVPGNSRQAKRR